MFVQLDAGASGVIRGLRLEIRSGRGEIKLEGMGEAMLSVTRLSYCSDEAVGSSVEILLELGNGEVGLQSCRSC